MNVLWMLHVCSMYAAFMLCYHCKNAAEIFVDCLGSDVKEQASKAHNVILSYVMPCYVIFVDCLGSDVKEKALNHPSYRDMLLLCVSVKCDCAMLSRGLSGE
jgi:hypothetical protein